MNVMKNVKKPILVMLNVMVRNNTFHTHQLDSTVAMVTLPSAICKFVEPEEGNLNFFTILFRISHAKWYKAFITNFCHCDSIYNKILPKCPKQFLGYTSNGDFYRLSILYMANSLCNYDFLHMYLIQSANLQVILV
jgi:hypothetical protein